MDKYRYIDLVKKLPKPTSEQFDNFIDIDSDFNASKYRNNYGYLTYFVNSQPDKKY